MLSRNSSKPEFSLTPRQYRFVDNWLGKGMSARKAAITAGYSEGYANQITTRLPREVRRLMVERVDDGQFNLATLVQKEMEILNNGTFTQIGQSLKRIYRLMGILD